MKSKLLSTITLCLLLPVFSACAPMTPAPASTGASESEATAAAPADAAGEKVTLRFAYNWTGGDTKAPYFEGAIAKYQEEHPNVEIVLEGTPGMEHQNKVKVDLAGGNLADVMVYWTGASMLEPLLDADAILDMADYFKVSTATKPDQWNDSAYTGSIIDGKTYVLPMESFKGFFVANKALFDQYGLEVPTTYAELKEVSKVFVENGIVPINMGSKGGNPGHLFYNAILAQLENGISDAENMGTTYDVSTDSFEKAAAIVSEMVSLKMFPDDTIANGDWGPAVALFNEGKAAMLFAFPWKINDIKPELLATSEVVAFPKMDDAAIDPATFSIGGVAMGTVINKDSFSDSAKQAAIVDFVDFLVSDAMFTELGKSSMMPAKMVELNPEGLNPLFVDAVKFSSPLSTYNVAWSFLPGAASQTGFSDAMDELFAGQAPQEVIAKFQEAVDQDKK